MKRVYWFLLLLVVWCIVCATWYMFSIKGLSTDLKYFNPQPRFIAIIEILLMLLIACLIGYAIGWKLWEDPIQILQESAQRLEMDNEALIKIKNEVEQELERVRKTMTQSQQAFNHSLSQSNETNELLRKELAELNLGVRQKESQALLASVAQLENELGALRFRVKQLEFQKQELEEANLKLKSEVEAHKQSLSRSSLVEPMHPFVRPPEMSEKDDLTQIKGIGPFIEKRLNMLGIYTFRQISEFTPETIEHISKAIEFFPKRIVRDNWMGQAKDFCAT
jgi:predicted flap endonuclease-1-like 5' DNA nuclease